MGRLTLYLTKFLTIIMSKEYIVSGLEDIFGRMTYLLNELTDEQYKTDLKILSEANIGQHYRHIIEYFLCLLNADTIVDYDNRKRDKTIENSKQTASEKLKEVIAQVKVSDFSKQLSLISNLSEEEDRVIETKTNLQRELLFCIEHAIHHMAQIKAGVYHHYPEVELHESFGLDFSTIRHHNVHIWGTANQ